jgi:hypothetical protein
VAAGGSAAHFWFFFPVSFFVVQVKLACSYFDQIEKFNSRLLRAISYNRKNRQTLQSLKCFSPG